MNIQRQNVLIILYFISANLFAQGNWNQRSNFAGGARREAVGFSIGNKGYIGTGICISGMNVFYYKDFWEWDATTNVWTQRSDFGGGPRIAAIGFSIGAKGYLGTGGDTLSGRANDLWEFDPAANVWTQKTNLNGMGRYYATGFSIGTKGYVGTGNYQGFINDLWEYDPALDTWTQRSGFSGGAREHAAGFSIGNKGYIGLGGDSVLRSDLWEFDPVMNSWTQKANFIGTPREGVVEFTIGSRAYLVSGYDGNFSNELWVWDQPSDSWSQLLGLPAGGRHGASGFAIGNKGYVGTGHNGPFTFYDDFWEYDPGISLIEDQEYHDQINIYPNPFSFNASLNITGEFSDANLIIYDITGNVVREIKNISNRDLLLERGELPAGSYYLQLQQKRGVTASKKILIID